MESPDDAPDTIPEPYLFPSVYRDYRDFLDPEWAFKSYHFNKVLREQPIFRAAIDCCSEKSRYRFHTDVYPAYLILCKYLSVFSDLEFIEVVYER